MGLLSQFNEWRANRYENHVSKMKEENKCPDCNGKGFQLYPLNESALFGDQLNCPGCNGSGLYSDWSQYS